MAVFDLEEQHTGRAARSTNDASEEREWLSKLRAELDGYCGSLGEFGDMDPGHVMATISSIHARLVHIRMQLHRSGSQRARAVRTQEVDPLIEALEFQFKCHSRSISLAEQEWRMAGGQGT